MMNEKALAAALDASMNSYLPALAACGDIADDYAFSKGFEEKMAAVFSRAKPDKRQKIDIRRRLKLAFVIAAVFASGFLMGAARKPLWNFFVDLTHGNISFEATNTGSAQKTMGLAYTLTDVPQGYKLVFSDITPRSYSESYVNEDNKTIFFTQEIVSNFESYRVTDAKTAYYTDEKGRQFFVCSVGKNVSVKWYDGNYIFSLYSELDKDTALELCKKAKVKTQDR